MADWRVDSLVAHWERLWVAMKVSWLENASVALRAGERVAETAGQKEVLMVAQKAVS